MSRVLSGYMLSQNVTIEGIYPELDYLNSDVELAGRLSEDAEWLKNILGPLPIEMTIIAVSTWLNGTVEPYQVGKHVRHVLEEYDMMWVLLSFATYSEELRKFGKTERQLYQRMGAVLEFKRIGLDDLVKGRV